jgi:hypothetical protein
MIALEARIPLQWSEEWFYSETEPRPLPDYIHVDLKTWLTAVPPTLSHPSGQWISPVPKTFWEQNDMYYKKDWDFLYPFCPFVSLSSDPRS